MEAHVQFDDVCLGDITDGKNYTRYCLQMFLKQWVRTEMQSSCYQLPYPSDDCINLELHYRKRMMAQGSDDASNRFVPICGNRTVDLHTFCEFDRFDI